MGFEPTVGCPTHVSRRQRSERRGYRESLPAYGWQLEVRPTSRFSAQDAVGRTSCDRLPEGRGRRTVWQVSFSAAALVLCCLAGRRWRAALDTWRTDGRLTSSPNAGQTMACAAGALGVRLEKPQHYVLNAA